MPVSGRTFLMYFYLVACSVHAVAGFSRILAWTHLKQKNKREISPTKFKHMDYSLCDLVIDHISNKKGIDHELIVNKKILNLIKI